MSWRPIRRIGFSSIDASISDHPTNPGGIFKQPSDYGLDLRCDGIC